MWGPDPDSPQSSWRGGLCEKTNPYLYGAAGLSMRIFSKRKTPSGQSGEFSCSSTSSHLSTRPPTAHLGVWGASAHIRSTGRVQLRGTWDYRHWGEWEPRKAHMARRRESAWTCGSGAAGELGLGMPECWWGRRRAGLGTLSWLQPKHQQNWLGQFEASSLFFFFFFKVILYYYYYFYFFFLLTPSSSLSCFLVQFLFSLPLYLFFLPSFFFYPLNWDKTWNCEKTRAGPKERASQQLRQWNKFHFYYREIARYCIFVLLFFSLFLHHSFY